MMTMMDGGGQKEESGNFNIELDLDERPSGHKTSCLMGELVTHVRFVLVWTLEGGS